MSYVSNCYSCYIRPEGLLHDAERDLLAIAKLLVTCECRVTSTDCLHTPYMIVSLLLNGKIKHNHHHHHHLYLLKQNMSIKLAAQ